jgi:hypothetical protein
MSGADRDEAFYETKKVVEVLVFAPELEGFIFDFDDWVIGTESAVYESDAGDGEW